jgi:hypothetical protein
VVDRCSAPTKFEPEYVVEHWTTKVLPELSYLYPLASGQEGMTTADVETIGLLKTEEIRIRRERLDSTNDCAIMNEWTESEKNEEKWEKPRRKLGKGK